MNKWMKKTASLLLAGALTLSVLPTAVFAQEQLAEGVPAEDTAAAAAQQPAVEQPEAQASEVHTPEQELYAEPRQEPLVFSQSGMFNVPKMSRQQIIDLLNESTVPQELYAVKPSAVAPYAAGQLTQESLNHGLNELNTARRLAGLTDVVLNEKYNRYCQYASVVNNANLELSHYPKQPKDMPDDFFAIGKEGARRSNLHSYRTSTLTNEWAQDPLHALVWDCMDDSDAGNVQALGHRRWNLNPQMGATGFGLTQRYVDGLYYGYMASYSVDFSAPASNMDQYDFIAWPASGEFPASVFEPHTAWSVTLNANRFAPIAKDSHITVTLTEQKSNRQWKFSTDEQYVPKNSGLYMTVNTSNYGSGAAIIFRPDKQDRYDGLYTVKIEGCTTLDGQPAVLEYQVNFFKAEQQPEEQFPQEQPMLYANSLSLAGDIAVNAFFDLPQWVLDEPSACITVEIDGTMEKIPVKKGIPVDNIVPGKRIYRFTKQVSARQMNDTIIFTITGKRIKQISYGMSVCDYSRKLLSSAGYPANIKNLVRNMLYYGACSQQNFNHKTDSLASQVIEAQELEKIKTKAQALTARDLDAFAPVVDKDMPKGLLQGVNLSLTSELSLRFSFDKAKAQGCTFELDGVPAEPKMVDGFTCIEVNNIVPQAMDKSHTVKVTQNGKSYTVTYSAMSYVRTVLDHQDLFKPGLIATAKALRLYNLAAKK